MEIILYKNIFFKSSFDFAAIAGSEFSCNFVTILKSSIDKLTASKL